MVKVFGVASVSYAFLLVKHMQMLELELITHSPYLSLEYQMVSFLQGLKSSFVLHITLLRNGQDYIRKVFRF